MNLFRSPSPSAADEHFGPVRPPPGRYLLHHASDRRHCAGGRGGFLPAAGGPAAGGGFPHHFCRSQPARGQPGDHGGVGRDPARAAVRADRGRDGDDFFEHARHYRHHPAIRLEPRYRRRGPRRRGGHQCGAWQPAHRSAEQPDLPQGQPGRFAHHDPGADLRHLQQGSDVRFGLDGACSEALAGQRGGAGDRRRQLSARRARGAQPIGAQQVRARAGTGAHRPLERERQSAQGPLRQCHPHLDHSGQRPALSRLPVQAADHRLSQQRAGPRGRCRRCRGFGGRYPQRRLLQRQALGLAHHLPPAGRQHHQGGGQHQRHPAHLARGNPEGDGYDHRDGSDDDHQRVDPGRGVYLGRRRAAGDPGGLRLPAQSAHDVHPGGRGAGLVDRHLRHHVPVRV